MKSQHSAQISIAPFPKRGQAGRFTATNITFAIEHRMCRELDDGQKHKNKGKESTAYLERLIVLKLEKF